MRVALFLRFPLERTLLFAPSGSALEMSPSSWAIPYLRHRLTLSQEFPHEALLEGDRSLRS